MLGTRGIPANYGGFETCVEELASRFAKQGHEVTVFGARAPEILPQQLAGIRVRYAPAIPTKATETISRTLISAIMSAGQHWDLALVFNVANVFAAKALMVRSDKVALHVDGLEWARDKWGRTAKRVFRQCERIAVQSELMLISDSRAISDYYLGTYGRETEYIAYGASQVQREQLPSYLGLSPGNYRLTVARLEPENNVHLAVEAHAELSDGVPLVVVGGARYTSAYGSWLSRQMRDTADVLELGQVQDQDLLDQLYANAGVVIHGHSVGGTNPSLLRALGAGSPVAALDTSYNREVCGPIGVYFSDAKSLAAACRDLAQQSPEAVAGWALNMQQNTLARYDWDDVARCYLDLI